MELTKHMQAMIEATKAKALVRVDSLATPRPNQCLAGTELKRLLSRFGFNADEQGCSCAQHATQMDSWGCDECEKRVGEIVGWLAVEAAKRKLPFSHTLAGVLVRRAIANARRAASR